MVARGGLLSVVSVGETTTVCRRQARLFLRVSGERGFLSPTLSRSSAEPMRRARTWSASEPRPWLRPWALGVKEAASLGGRAALYRAGRALSGPLAEEGFVLEDSLRPSFSPGAPAPPFSARAPPSSIRSRERALLLSPLLFFLASVSHWISLWELNEGRGCSLWVVEEEEKEEEEGVVERAPPSLLSPGS